MRYLAFATFILCIIMVSCTEMQTSSKVALLTGQKLEADHRLPSSLTVKNKTKNPGPAVTTCCIPDTACLVTVSQVQKPHMQPYSIARLNKIVKQLKVSEIVRTSLINPTHVAISEKPYLMNKGAAKAPYGILAIVFLVIALLLFFLSPYIAPALIYVGIAAGIALVLLIGALVLFILWLVHLGDK